MWYRITCNADGSLASCEHHEGSRTCEGKSIFFVEADSPEQAIAKWARNYDRMRAKNVARRTALDRKNRLNGLCSCGRPRDAGFKSCAECREYDRDRARRRAAGIPARSRLTEEERAQRWRLAVAKSAAAIKARGGGRAAMLRANLRRLDTFGAALFRDWLVAEIYRLEAKARNKLSLPEAAE